MDFFVLGLHPVYFIRSFGSFLFVAMVNFLIFFLFWHQNVVDFGVEIVMG